MVRSSAADDEELRGPITAIVAVVSTVLIALEYAGASTAHWKQLRASRRRSRCPASLPPPAIATADFALVAQFFKGHLNAAHDAWVPAPGQYRRRHEGFAVGACYLKTWRAGTACRLVQATGSSWCAPSAHGSGMKSWTGAVVRGSPAVSGVLCRHLCALSADHSAWTTSRSGDQFHRRGRATLNNIGPGLEAVGPTCNFSGFSVLSKLVLITDMLLGRLRRLPILCLLSRHTWRRQVK